MPGGTANGQCGPLFCRSLPADALAIHASGPRVPFGGDDCASSVVLRLRFAASRISSPSPSPIPMATGPPDCRPSDGGLTGLIMEHLLSGFLVQQAVLHDRCRSCTEQPREWQPSARPRLARGGHHHGVVAHSSLRGMCTCPCKSVPRQVPLSQNRNVSCLKRPSQTRPPRHTAKRQERLTTHHNTHERPLQRAC